MRRTGRELRAGMTPANRAELRGESEREGRKGARVPPPPPLLLLLLLLLPPRGRRTRGEKENEGRERDANEEGEKPARASGRSLGPRVPRHGLVSLYGLHGQRSSSSTSHLRVLNLLPRESRRRRLTRINRIINDRSRCAPRDAPPRSAQLDSGAFEICAAPTLMSRVDERVKTSRYIIWTSASDRRNVKLWKLISRIVPISPIVLSLTLSSANYSSLILVCYNYLVINLFIMYFILTYIFTIVKNEWMSNEIMNLLTISWQYKEINYVKWHSNHGRKPLKFAERVIR